MYRVLIGSQLAKASEFSFRGVLLRYGHVDLPTPRVFPLSHFPPFHSLDPFLFLYTSLQFNGLIKLFKKSPKTGTMWCDNCLLIFPLRAGAIVLGSVIAIFNIVGGIILFKYGEFFFFSFYPEWSLFGGLTMAVAAVAVINVIALSSRSYLFSRVCNFTWPFAIVLSAIGGIAMVVELQRGKNDIITECNNGGQLFSGSPDQPAPGTISPVPPATLPDIFCKRGFQSLYTVFIVCLVINLIMMLYMFFVNWRYVKRVQHYTALQGPYAQGFYKG